jgi:putative transposase
MARRLRIEFPARVYHATPRGNRREDIYTNDADRRYWLNIFGDVRARYKW